MNPAPYVHATLTVLARTAWEAGGRSACSLLDRLRQRVARRGEARVEIDLSELPSLDTAAIWEELIGLIDAAACCELTIRTKMASLPERRVCVGWMVGICQCGRTFDVYGSSIHCEAHPPRDMVQHLCRTHIVTPLPPPTPRCIHAGVCIVCIHRQQIGITTAITPD